MKTSKIFYFSAYLTNDWYYDYWPLLHQTNHATAQKKSDDYVIWIIDQNLYSKLISPFEIGVKKKLFKAIVNVFFFIFQKYTDCTPNLTNKVYSCYNKFDKYSYLDTIDVELLWKTAWIQIILRLYHIKFKNTEIIGLRIK